MGRRWGKTVLGGTLSVACAARGAAVAWIVPTYKNGRPLWRWAENTVAPLKQTRRVEVHRTDRTIQFLGGGFLGVYSMDNEDSIRGEAFHLVIVDEAARIPESAWTDAIMPTLADYDGRAFLISTPKGKNWFWQEWLCGQEGRGDIASWQSPTADNPNPKIQKAARLARERIPERSYRQEWLAEFVEDGAVFRNVRACATAAEQPPQDDHTYVIGCDWGKVNDFTVFTVMDATTRQVVALDRSNRVEYYLQRQRLRVLNERYKPLLIVAEENSIGMPIIEELRREDLPVQPFTTTNATKAALIDALALAFEQQTIAIPNHATLIGELLAFEMTKTATGMPKYAAPEGMHDDMVMSLALAYHACERPNAADLISFVSLDDGDDGDTADHVV